MSKIFIFICLAILILASFSPWTQNVICSLIICGENNVLYFDALNALFTGLAFLGLVATLFLQWKDLRDTKEDVDKQNKTLALQIFETSFFSMLSQHNAMVYSIVIKGRRGKSIIRDIVQGIFSKNCGIDALVDMIENQRGEKIITPDIVDIYYSSIYQDFSSFLGVYFRSLYRVFVFIDNSKIENKELYADIVRSQLSDDEIIILFINGLSKKGHKFRLYIEKYALLNNLPLDKITPEMKDSYSNNAYDE